MFDFAWSELGLIAVVAMILIGPKDMPLAIRTVTGWIKKARRMAAEFQTHVDELVREAELEELREKVQKAAATPLASHVEALVDPGRELSSALGRKADRSTRVPRNAMLAAYWCPITSCRAGTLATPFHSAIHTV